MSGRTYEGPPIDGTYQHISERPFGDDDGETVYVTEPDDGREQVENVPVPGPESERDVEGQTTLDDWGWSA